MNLSRNAASYRNRGEKDRLPYMFPVNIKFSNIKILDLYCKKCTLRALEIQKADGGGGSGGRGSGLLLFGGRLGMSRRRHACLGCV